MAPEARFPSDSYGVIVQSFPCAAYLLRAGGNAPVPVGPHGFGGRVRRP